MSYLEYNTRSVPSGFGKLLHVHWAIVLLLLSVAGFGLLMLYSVSGGVPERWMMPQAERFVAGLCLMLFIAMFPIWFWRNLSVLAYIVAFALLVGVHLFGETRGGAQRWIDLGFMDLQASELMKLGIIMILAAYYDWIPTNRVSNPLYMLLPLVLILAPTFLIIEQPDLGTAILTLAGGGAMMFLAGVHWAYFVSVIGAGIGAVWTVLESRGTDWQILRNYQYARIDTFLNPGNDPLGSGYNITQAKIALGSGGWTGRGFMQGTQTRLDFLPEAHTDFIFTTLAEEFGFVGAFTLLVLYGLIIFFCIATALTNTNRFAALLTLGVAMTFFLYFAVNMAMVMGLAPVVGVPLPLVSYGGSAMLVLLIGFGLVQSAHVHKPR